ncbi:MAG: hypothetical protein FWF44_05210 [Defluviitaleaceae bacterium]|nr:hypothetical protein [Defluviitaleaceae bacterium]
MENNMIVWVIVLASLVISALGTVMIRNLLTAAVALALTSAILTVALFIMGAQLAAVIELSVCAGLVTAVFATTISLTKTDKAEELAALKKERLGRFLPLPFILVVLIIGIVIIWPGMDITILGGNFSDAASRQVLWDQRALDMIGLALIILAGVLGVSVLFREHHHDDEHQDEHQEEE